MPTRFATLDDLRGERIAQRRTITFSENDTADKFYIDGKLFDPHRIDVWAKLNTTEEWRLRNVSTEEHTFHTHVNDFQVISVNAKPYDAHSWQDAVQLPIGGEVVIRMKFSGLRRQVPLPLPHP